MSKVDGWSAPDDNGVRERRSERWRHHDEHHYRVQFLRHAGDRTYSGEMWHVSRGGRIRSLVRYTTRTVAQAKRIGDGLLALAIAEGLRHPW